MQLKKKLVNHIPDYFLEFQVGKKINIDLVLNSAVTIYFSLFLNHWGFVEGQCEGQ